MDGTCPRNAGTLEEDEMGLLDFLFGTAIAMNVLDSHAANRSQDGTELDDNDEALFDDGYPDDYVGDGLDGEDDYVGDGLDGEEDGEDEYDDDLGW